MKTIDDVYERLKKEYNLSSINIGFIDPNADMEAVYTSTKATLDKLMAGDYEEVLEEDD